MKEHESFLSRKDPRKAEGNNKERSFEWEASINSVLTGEPEKSIISVQESQNGTSIAMSLSVSKSQKEVSDKGDR